MTDGEWERLLARIASGYCTPFLGAGAAFGTLPLGSDIAERWSREAHYPLEDSHDLGRVAQFVGIDAQDPMWPKEKLSEELKGIGPPDFDRANEPHAVLAKLPLPVYMTTNYDDFMTKALVHAEKQPQREICRWNSSPSLRAEPTVFADPDFTPTPATPVVYHLHGRLGLPESLVLTEDDYLDFLVAVSREPDLLPSPIQMALAGSSLLFVGYRLADWDFRVLHRGLVMAGEQSLRRLSVTVQLKPSEAAQTYLAQYFEAMNVRVYWGSAEDFMAELGARWEARTPAGSTV
jgi:SIR2-like protein